VFWSPDVNHRRFEYFSGDPSLNDSFCAQPFIAQASRLARSLEELTQNVSHFENAKVIEPQPGLKQRNMLLQLPGDGRTTAASRKSTLPGGSALVDIAEHLTGSGRVGSAGARVCRSDRASGSKSASRSGSEHERPSGGCGSDGAGSEDEFDSVAGGGANDRVAATSTPKAHRMSDTKGIDSDSENLTGSWPYISSCRFR
jgi:hypothetical protein